MAEVIKENFSLESLIFDLSSSFAKTPFWGRGLDTGYGNWQSYTEWIEEYTRTGFNWLISQCNSAERFGAVYQQMRGHYDNPLLEQKRKDIWRNYTQALDASKGHESFRAVDLSVPALDAIPHIEFIGRNSDREIFKTNTQLQFAFAKGLGLAYSGLPLGTFLHERGQYIEIGKDRLNNFKLEQLSTKYPEIRATVGFVCVTDALLDELLAIDAATPKIWLTIPRDLLLADYARTEIKEIEAKAKSI